MNKLTVKSSSQSYLIDKKSELRSVVQRTKQLQQDGLSADLGDKSVLKSAGELFAPRGRFAAADIRIETARKLSPEIQVAVVKTGKQKLK